jgi:catecholate siderophore receptor
VRIFRRFRNRTTAGVAAAGAFVAGTLASPWAGPAQAHTFFPEMVAARHRSPDQRRLYDFAIPEGPLAEALVQVSALTGVTITADPDRIQGILSAAVNGRFTLEEGLRQLLEGTAFGFRYTSAAAIVVDLALTEFVAVAGELPRSTNAKLPGELRDQPQTITVIPHTVIEAQGATTLRDVLRNVPGITYQAGEGGGGLPGDKLTMRGFSADSDIFIDGVRDVGAYTRDAFNIEQVEVIKGPSSAIGGRGSTGGSINLTSKAAHLSEARSLTLGVGSASYQRGTLDVNQPIDGLPGASLRLNAMWTDTGYAGRDVVENESWAVAPSLALGLGTRVRATLNYQHIEQNNVPDYGLSWAAFDATPPVDQSNFYGLVGYDYEDISNDIGTALLEGDLAPGVTLRNSTRLGTTIRDSAITAPRPPNRQLQQRYYQTDVRANVTNLTASFDTGAARHDLTTGVEFLREGVLTYNQAQNTNQPHTTLIDPNPEDRPLGPMPTNLGTIVNDAVTTTAGLYLFDTLNLNPRLQLSGGLRWDHAVVDYRGLTRATGDVLALSRTDRMLSWRAGIVVRPHDLGSVYLGYNTAFNPTAQAGNTGTSLTESPTTINSINLEPETTRSLELGTKWDVAGNRVGLTAAVFRTEKVNARTRSATNDPFVLDGMQRVTGVEVGVSGLITPSWSILANVALMDSDIVASRNAAEQGQDFALTPERSASVWSSYTLPWDLTVGGGVQFQDAVFRNTLNTLSVPSYYLLSATASYPLNQGLTLRVNGDNLTDEVYADRVGGGHYIPGPRRTVKLSIDVRF